jgi:hypothetical protein
LPTRDASKQTQRAAYNNSTNEISNAIHVLISVSYQQGLYYYSICTYMSKKLKVDHQLRHTNLFAVPSDKYSGTAFDKNKKLPDI